MLSGARPTAVLDSGPLIHLSWIGRLDLLTTIFSEALAPPAVRDEALAAPEGTSGIAEIRSVFRSGDVRVQASAKLPDPAILAAVDEGEAAAIQLAEEVGADLFVTDDAPARLLAEGRGLTVTGTLGILYLARERGLIPAVLPFALELRRHGQWIGDRLMEQIEREERGGEASQRGHHGR